MVLCCVLHIKHTCVVEKENSTSNIHLLTWNFIDRFSCIFTTVTDKVDFGFSLKLKLDGLSEGFREYNFQIYSSPRIYREILHNRFHVVRIKFRDVSWYKITKPVKKWNDIHFLIMLTIKIYNVVVKVE